MNKLEGTRPVNPDFLLGCLCFVLSFLCLSSLLQNGFVNIDDAYLVLENPQVVEFSSRNTLDIFWQHLTGGHHRVIPLSFFLFSIQYYFFETAASGYHLVSLLVHCFNTVLLYSIFRKINITKQIALAAALVFGIHPIHIEPVAWLSSQPTVFFSFFYLLSLRWYVLSLNSPFRRKFLSFSLAAFVLALLCKGSAITLPVLMFAVEYFVRRNLDRRSVTEKIPFLLVAGVFAVLNYCASVSAQNYGQGGGFLLADYYPFWDRLYLSCYALVKYFTSVVLPINLSAYDPIASYYSWQIYFFTFLVVLVFILLVWGFIKFQFTLFHLSAALFVIPLSLLLHFHGVTNSLISHRYAYLASAGGILFVAAIVDWLVRRSGNLVAKIFWGIAFLFWVGFLCSVSTQRIPVWKNSHNLWTDVIRKYPDSPRAYFFLALDYLSRGHPDAALTVLDIALAQNPQYGPAHLYKANAQVKMSRYEEALGSYTSAISFLDQNAGAYGGRGDVYRHLREYDKALEDYTKVITLYPAHAEFYNKRADVLIQKGDYKNALKDIETALKLDYHYLPAVEKYHLLNQSGTKNDNY